MKRYFTDCVENMRDIGGYMTPQGAIPYGRLVRSNLVITLPAENIDFLLRLGIHTAVDLRTHSEKDELVSVFESCSDFTAYHYPFIFGDRIPSSTDEVAKIYLDIASETENVKNILTTLFNSDGGVVYYCFAGKDRTGVVTALVMLILGVSEDDIVADYTLSAEFLADKLEEYSVTFDIRKELLTPQPRFMREFLAGFKQKYGSIDDYLQQMNLSAVQFREQIFGHK